MGTSWKQYAVGVVGTDHGQGGRRRTLGRGNLAAPAETAASGCVAESVLAVSTEGRSELIMREHVLSVRQ